MDDKIKIVFKYVKKHKWDNVEKILDNNVNIELNYRDDTKNYLINYIVIFNKINILNKLLNRKLKIDVIDQSGLSIYYYPIKFNYLKIIKLLNKINEQNIGEDINNMNDTYGNNSLFYCIQFNRYKLFKYLINKGNKINILNSKGTSPLILSIKLNRFKFIKYLIKKGININDNHNNNINYPIFFINDNTELLIKLLKYNLDLNLQNNKNLRTILMDFIILGNNEIIHEILDKDLNINLNIQDINGKTFFHYLFKYANLENISEYFSKFDKKGIFYNNNLQETKVDQIKISDKLYINYVDLNLLDYRGQSALHIFINSDNYEMMNNITYNFFKILIDNTNLNLQDNKGNTCLYYLFKNLVINNYDFLSYKKTNLFIKNLDDENIFDLIPKNNLDYILNKISESYYKQLQEQKDNWNQEWENKCSNKVLEGKLYDKNKCLKIIKNKIIENSVSKPIKKNKLDIIINSGIFMKDCYYTGITLDIIFGLIYLYNYTNEELNINIKTTIQDNLIYNNNLLLYSNSLGLGFSETSFCNISIWYIFQKIFFPQNIEINLKKYFNDLSIEVIIIPIGIITENGNHANILFINKNNKTIERFEPNGKYGPLEMNINYFELDKNIQNYFNLIDSEYKYFSSVIWEPIIGLQLLEIIEDSCRKYTDPNGFCGSWCIWWCYYKLKYIDQPSEILINKIINKIKREKIGFKNTIRNFSLLFTKERDTVLKYNNLDIDDFLNDNFTKKEFDNIVIEIKKYI